MVSIWISDKTEFLITYEIRNFRFRRRFRRQAMSGDILLNIAARLLGSPQAPDRTLCVRSNTPTAWLLSLPLVAPSCTSAQEDKPPFRGLVRIVSDSRKSKGPSGGDHRFSVLSNRSQGENPQGQNRQGLFQIGKFLLYQD